VDLEMKADQWTTGRNNAGLTQVAAARLLSVSQPYLCQIETGLRVASAALTRKAAKLYGLRPTVLPLDKAHNLSAISPDNLQQTLASLGYPGFEHVRTKVQRNPAEVVLSAVLQRDLDTRLVEALPWVLSTYADLDWGWLRDHTKLQNAQNRLGYLIHLALVLEKEKAGEERESRNAVQILSEWQNELEEARLAHEGTLCRDSMPERERDWLRKNRSDAAAHWSLLTGLTAGQLPYAPR
jgi:transcriptional regulator with XRE-family HTH domain